MSDGVPLLYPVSWVQLMPSRAAMPDRVSPLCTTYVRDPPLAVVPPLWQTTSPGYTRFGSPLGTVTFHQSLQYWLTVCPLWMVTQELPQPPALPVSVAVPPVLPEGVMSTALPSGCAGFPPAYAAHVVASP